ncbi:MAG: O-antigen ligase family protein [Micropruina sp.]|uniref:O-antigen ligase family protein n=1 Tax=Micropruina sp. TaxID=2737536 RepID=UPI0039E213E5
MPPHSRRRPGWTVREVPASTVGVTSAAHDDATAAQHSAERVPLYVWLFLAGLTLTMFAGFTDQIGLPIPLDRPLLALAAVLWIAEPGRERLRARAFYAVAAATILWTTLSWMSTWPTADSSTTFALLDRVVMPLAMFPLGAVVFSTAQRRELLLRTAALMAIYAGFTGLAQYLGLRGLLFPRYLATALDLTPTARVGGPWLAPEPLGMVSVLAIFMAGLLVHTSRSSLWRVIGAVGVVGGSIGTVVCLTRSTWLSAVLAGLVVCLMVPRLRRRLPLALLLGVAFATAALVLLPEFRDELLQRLFYGRSVDDRQNTNAAALRIIEQMPLFGIGWGEFINQNILWVRQADDYPVTSVVIEVHNVFLSRAAETGVLGAVLWALCFATGPMLGVLAKPQQAWSRHWKLLGIAAFFVWLVPSLTSPNPYLTPNYLIWLLWGVAARGILIDLPERTGRDD